MSEVTNLARQLRYPLTLDVKVQLDVRGRPLRRVICGGADGVVVRFVRRQSEVAFGRATRFYDVMHLL